VPVAPHVTPQNVTGSMAPSAASPTPHSPRNHSLHNYVIDCFYSDHRVDIVPRLLRLMLTAQVANFLRSWHFAIFDRR
jgi:hypothetical protein